MGSTCGLLKALVACMRRGETDSSYIVVPIIRMAPVAMLKSVPSHGVGNLLSSYIVCCSDKKPIKFFFVFKKITMTLMVHDFKVKVSP